MQSIAQAKSAYTIQPIKQLIEFLFFLVNILEILVSAYTNAHNGHPNSEDLC